ncbi:MAG TPA: SRPBCC family protein [Cyclobacteriaceae bacterium]|nr:SRPBCC family protein [Cyclobacteriaceae bacterium]HRJ82938.1 SRPBCC family protein [Cyclobacteriaceae bacterium]
MKILKIVGLGLLTIVVIVAAVIAIQSPQKHLERSVVINAQPASVFEEVSSFQNFNKFSPWHKLDPQAQYTFEGPASGVGSKMSWVSDHSQVGSGSQEIVGVEENKLVKIKMDFGNPGQYFASYVLTPVDGGTKVTWTYDGDVSGTGLTNASVGKLFHMFIEGMLGGMYESGLADLKAMVEAKPVFTVKITEETINPISYVGLSTTMSTTDMNAVSLQMGKSYGELMAVLQKSKVEMTGAPFCLYPRWDEEKKEMDMVCALPVPADAKLPPKYSVMQIAGGKAVKAIHLGDYHKLEATHNQLAQYMEYKKLEAIGAPWEVYITDPETEPDTAKWITEVYYPVKGN